MEDKPNVLAEILPSASNGEFFLDIEPPSEILAKPKIMPIKSAGLVQLEVLERALNEVGQVAPK